MHSLLVAEEMSDLELHPVASAQRIRLRGRRNNLRPVHRIPNQIGGPPRTSVLPADRLYRRQWDRTSERKAPNINWVKRRRSGRTGVTDENRGMLKVQVVDTRQPEPAYTFVTDALEKAIANQGVYEETVEGPKERQQSIVAQHSRGDQQMPDGLFKETGWLGCARPLDGFPSDIVVHEKYSAWQTSRRVVMSPGWSSAAISKVSSSNSGGNENVPRVVDIERKEKRRASGGE
ncbi:hypothetical protein DFH09DRAFT_1285295 [Mycena vulgaris]|nr:hypothetical protein DFH09DRAFT_1285295 [Mycena vulgaris]